MLLRRARGTVFKILNNERMSERPEQCIYGGTLSDVCCNRGIINNYTCFFFFTTGVYFSGRAVAYATRFLAMRLTFQSKSRGTRLTFFLLIYLIVMKHCQKIII